ncbi:MAG: FAD binding domain-containing protein [Candidatus Poseidoniaceae archaeon]|nr:FAD binding domain-containing protein [Candidatus Poseidoniaceae archaeon]
MMLMPPFNLHHPETVEEACELASTFLANEESFDWVAGGTDLLPNYKWHINVKKHVISLANIQGIDAISMHEIGAMARLGALTTSDSVHPLIASAASKVASSLIRNNATLGGNICLDTRCFWFNQSEDWRRSIDWCHKEDCGTGSDCRVIPNQNTLCVATYQGDLAPSLMVLEGTIHIIGPNGQREVPVGDFFQLDGITRNVLEQGEFIVKVTFPEGVENRIGSYKKLRVRESWDFPEAGVASSWIVGDPSSLRIASTALESIPRSHQSEVDSFEEAFSSDLINPLSEVIMKSIKPVNNTALPPRYRKSMIRVLVKRSLREIIGDKV